MIWHPCRVSPRPSNRYARPRAPITPGSVGFEEAEPVRRSGARERVPLRGTSLKSSGTADLATLAAFASEERGPECLGCGAPLVAKRADARYCQQGCKSRAKRARKGTSPGTVIASD